MERRRIGKACRDIDEIFDECPREKELGDAVGAHNARSLELSTEERKTRGKHLREGKRGVGRATRLECFTRSHLKGVKRIPWWGWFSVKKLLGNTQSGKTRLLSTVLYENGLAGPVASVKERTNMKFTFRFDRSHVPPYMFRVA
ncbi:hypothetical protein HZH66_003822 [Vespula vulgaris]|uniref:Uncharacterized protein n=1 Tax=Vespula vulgaris TaxID=7454 RepID=A0A834KDU0_VESVU|nr:hypothetical protein HZH66_003822 [Vespula vulgaris]